MKYLASVKKTMKFFMYGYGMISKHITKFKKGRKSMISILLLV